MKKMMIVLLACLMASAGVVVADISINLTCATGAMLIHNGTVYPGDQLAAGSMIQLIWSLANAYTASGNPVSQTDAQGNTIVQPTLFSPSTYLLWTGYIPGSSWGADLDGTFDYDNADVGGNNVNAGYVYARVFDSANPSEGSWYASSLIYNTAGFAQATNVPKPTPDQVEMADGPGSTFDEGAGGYYLPLNQGQVVPEPTTLALALAGLGLLVYRRFRK